MSGHSQFTFRALNFLFLIIIIIVSQTTVLLVYFLYLQISLWKIVIVLAVFTPTDVLAGNYELHFSATNRYGVIYRYGIYEVSKIFEVLFNDNYFETNRETSTGIVIKTGCHDHTLLLCRGYICQSLWPRGLRRGPSANGLLGSWVRIPQGARMLVSCECCVLSGRGLCDGLITRPEESYRLRCVQMSVITKRR
jgi:hypothetical protein